MSTHTMKIKITDHEVKIKGNTYVFSALLTISTDDNYGADADGNRGTSATWIDDYEFDYLSKIETNDKAISQQDMENVFEYLDTHLQDFL